MLAALRASRSLPPELSAPCAHGPPHSAEVLFALDERTLALERPPGTERSKAAAASSSAPTGRSYTFDAVLNDVGQAEVYTSGGRAGGVGHQGRGS